MISSSAPTASRTASTTGRSRRQSLECKRSFTALTPASRRTTQRCARSSAETSSRSTRRPEFSRRVLRGAAREADLARVRRGPRRRPRASSSARDGSPPSRRSGGRRRSANGSMPTSKRSRSSRSGSASPLAYPSTPSSERTTTTGRILVRARRRIPGCAERRVERIAVPPRLDRRDLHYSPP